MRSNGIVINNNSKYKVSSIMWSESLKQKSMSAGSNNGGTTVTKAIFYNKSAYIRFLANKSNKTKCRTNDLIMDTK